MSPRIFQVSGWWGGVRPAPLAGSRRLYPTSPRRLQSGQRWTRISVILRTVSQRCRRRGPRPLAMTVPCFLEEAHPAPRAVDVADEAEAGIADGAWFFAGAGDLESGPALHAPDREVTVAERILELVGDDSLPELFFAHVEDEGLQLLEPLVLRSHRRRRPGRRAVVSPPPLGVLPHRSSPCCQR